MTSPLLALHDVTRRYGKRTVVDTANLTLNPGRITCLLGPSGCGKSTMLRLIAGLERIDGGTIEIGGVRVAEAGYSLPPEQRSVGLVFQDFALFPHLNVVDNIAFGLKHLDAGTRQARVERLLKRFHVDRLATAWPHTLSGGEQQRVAIARALAREPDILLLDEPFSGLDGHLRASVRQTVLADLRAAGSAVLIVTHDPEEAMLIADDLILMSAGQILQTGSPLHCYRKPQSIAAARLLGDMVLLPAQVSAGRAVSPFGTAEAPNLPDGPAQIMLRPESFRLDPDGTDATITQTGFGGAFHHVTLEAEGAAISIRLTQPPPAVGTRTGLHFDSAQACIYPV